jgi:hypothetical protein
MLLGEIEVIQILGTSIHPLDPSPSLSSPLILEYHVMYHELLRQQRNSYAGW